MRAEPGGNLEHRVQSAVAELQGVISIKYPNATFVVARDRDEPENVDLLTTVDLEDPDEVPDFEQDRLIQLQVDERIPVHVIPLRTPERIQAELNERGQHDRARRILVAVGRGRSSAET